MKIHNNNTNLPNIIFIKYSLHSFHLCYFPCLKSRLLIKIAIYLHICLYIHIYKIKVEK